MGQLHVVSSQSVLQVLLSHFHTTAFDWTKIAVGTGFCLAVITGILTWANVWCFLLFHAQKVAKRTFFFFQWRLIDRSEVKDRFLIQIWIFIVAKISFFIISEANIVLISQMDVQRVETEQQLFPTQSASKKIYSIVIVWLENNQGGFTQSAYSSTETPSILFENKGRYFLRVT